MSNVIAYIDKECQIMYMAGDSAANESGYHQTIIENQKVFEKYGNLIGYVGSFRISQIIRFTPFDTFSISFGENRDSILNLLITQFVPELQEVLKKNNCLQVFENGKNIGLAKSDRMLLAINGFLFCVYEDFNVAPINNNYYAIGCGKKYSLGSLYTTNEIENIRTEDKINTAMHAANYYSSGVRPPYSVLTQKYEL